VAAALVPVVVAPVVLVVVVVAAVVLLVAAALPVALLQLAPVLPERKLSSLRELVSLQHPLC